MTLLEFIASKPKELRLGQYFYNCYLWNTLTQEEIMSDKMQKFYNSRDMRYVFLVIDSVMKERGWKDLPNV